MIDNSDLIVQYFGFLVDEYDFHIEQKVFDYQTMGNAFATFKSPVIAVEVVIDRNQVLINIGDQSLARKEWFDFSDVLKYFAPYELAYDFGEKTEVNTWDEVVETQLRRLAILLRQHCKNLLNGDFSMRDEIAQIEKKRAAEMLEQFNKLSQAYREKRLKIFPMSTLSL